MSISPYVEATQKDLTWLRKEVQHMAWRWAITFEDSYPHMYVLRGRNIDEDTYLRMFRVIQRFGEPRKFLKRINIELDLDGAQVRFGGGSHPKAVVEDVKLWAMSNKISDTFAINLAPQGFEYGEQENVPHTASREQTVYDAVATAYDERYQSPEAHRENMHAWKVVVEDRKVESLLDVGCGTGLALDLKIVRSDEPSRYRGIDPSQGMLNQLAFKHPFITDLWPLTVEDYLDRGEVKKFDTVISLFGAPSYFTPEAIRRLPELAERRLVLMHYREGYLPDYHTEDTRPRYADESREAAAALPGAEVSHLNNFQIVKVRL